MRLRLACTPWEPLKRGAQRRASLCRAEGHRELEQQGGQRRPTEASGSPSDPSPSSGYGSRVRQMGRGPGPRAQSSLGNLPVGGGLEMDPGAPPAALAGHL